MASMSIVKSGFGRITLADGSKLVLRVAIVSVSMMPGSSPFGGVNLAVKTAGGVAIEELPEELKKAVADKPVVPPWLAPPDGWEYVDIVSQEPAFEEVEVVIGGRRFIVRVESDAAMIARNLKYRSIEGEPFYAVNWVDKVRWKPVE